MMVLMFRGLYRRGKLLSTTIFTRILLIESTNTSVQKCVSAHEKFTCPQPVSFEGAWKLACNAHVC